jgi:hypothetical protein
MVEKKTRKKGMGIKTSVKSGNFRKTKAGAGMTKKGVAAYRKANPGSKLKTAVTGKVKKGSKDAKRRKSFCARSAGQMKQLKTLTLGYGKLAEGGNVKMEQKVQETVAVHSAEIEHMKKDVDHIIVKVDKMDKSIDEIKETLAEFKGGKRVAMWFFGFIGVVAGSIVTWFLGK